MEKELIIREKYNERQMALLEDGKFDEYLNLLDSILKLQPENAGLLLNKGTALYKLGRLKDAIAVFRQALDIRPNDANAETALSMALLKNCEYKEGWKLWERRLEIPPLSDFSAIKIPRWNGKSEGSKILLRCEQGLGDSIQFARYIPALRERCSKLAFVCRKELLSLFEGFPGIDELPS